VTLLAAVIVASLAWFANHGLTRASSESASLNSLPEAVPSFGPTKMNQAAAPASPPPGMVWIAGGEFSMGANDPPDMNEVGMRATEDARPIRSATQPDSLARTT
jgi:formylglycine-generating enzyme required for sulfatase activity